MKKVFSFLLSLLVICAAMPLAPVTAQAYENYTQTYDAEYYVPASASFIYQIGLYYSSSSDADAISHIEAAGFTPFGGDFNGGAGGKYVHAGYKTTSDPTKAITAVRVWDFTAGGDDPQNPRDSVTSTVGGAACTFYRVGSGASEWTPNVLDGDVNLNQGNSGHHLKLYVTTDRNAGPQLSALDTAHNKTAATAYNTLLNAGYTVATSFQAPSAYQDLNAGAGSNSDYNYLGFRSAMVAVDSSGLRSAYAAAKERYEHGGAGFGFLSPLLTAAAAILADLSDGYTSSTQAQIDAAAAAIEDAIPTYTVTLNPDDVSGDPIVFVSTEQTVIPMKNGAAFNEFYFDENGKMGFRLDCENFPADWSRPMGMEFCGFSGAAEYNTLRQQETVFTARWDWINCSISITSSITLDYNSIDENGFLPITLKVNDINFGEIEYDPEEIPSVTLTLGSGSLEDEKGENEINFDVYAPDHSRVVESLAFTPDSVNRTYDLALKFSPNALKIAKSGVYSCRYLCGLGSRYGSFPENVEIELTMDKPAIYSVTLIPDIGSYDEAIVFISTQQEVIPAKNDADYYEFYYDEDGKMGFRLDCENYPADWNPLRGRVFRGYSDATEYNTLSQQETVFTSEWDWTQCSIRLTSSIGLDYNSMDANGFLPITLKVEDINFGGVEYGAEIPYVVLYLGSYSLEDETGKNNLHFNIYAADHSGIVDSLTFTPDSMNQTYDLALKFDPDELNRTPYGAYACYYGYEVESPYGEFHVVGSEMGGGLELTMDKPDTKIYSVTVSSEGHGTAYASLGSGTTGTQVILTATPDDGWYLREWQIVSGNVRVTENRFDISHANVEIKAIFEEIATHTRTVTVMYTQGGTAHASLASGVYGTQVTLTAVPENGYAFKEWQVVCGGVTVTDNRFTIGDDDVEIRAVFILKPFYSVEIPNLITVKPKAVFTTVTVTVPELSMVPEANGKTPRQLRIAFDAGVLNNQTDPSKTLTYNLAFSMYQSSYGRQVIRSFTSAGNDAFYIRIPDSNWNAAASGVYTGTMSYHVYWFYTDNSMSGTLQSGTIPITVTIPAQPGDVDSDGEVDLADVTLLSRYLAGGWNVTVDETVADVNKDGIIDLKDVVLIRRYLAGGWDVELK